MRRTFRVDGHICGWIDKYKKRFQRQKKAFEKLSQIYFKCQCIVHGNHPFITNFILNINLLTCLRSSKWQQTKKKPHPSIDWAGESQILPESDHFGKEKKARQRVLLQTVICIFRFQLKWREISRENATYIFGDFLLSFQFNKFNAVSIWDNSINFLASVCIGQTSY